MINLTRAYDLNLELLTFNSTGTNITVMKLIDASRENDFTHSYSLTGPATIEHFSMVSMYCIALVSSM